jgi:hypothetical protein
MGILGKEGFGQEVGRERAEPLPNPIVLPILAPTLGLALAPQRRNSR